MFTLLQCLDHGKKPTSFGNLVVRHKIVVPIPNCHFKYIKVSFWRTFTNALLISLKDDPWIECKYTTILFSDWLYDKLCKLMNTHFWLDTWQTMQMNAHFWLVNSCIIRANVNKICVRSHQNDALVGLIYSFYLCPYLCSLSRELSDNKA